MCLFIHFWTKTSQSGKKVKPVAFGFFHLNFKSDVSIFANTDIGSSPVPLSMILPRVFHIACLKINNTREIFRILTEDKRFSRRSK